MSAAALCRLPPAQWSTACGVSAAAAASGKSASGGAGEPFASWSGLLPSAATFEDERRVTYVKARSSGNQYFFEDIRNHLLDLTQALRMRMILDPASKVDEAGGAAPQGSGSLDAVALAGAHKVLLQGLHAGKGFLGHREQHKSLALFELCADLAEHLATAGGRPAGSLFFSLLTRLGLADALAHFKKPSEASEILEETLRLVRQQEEEEGAGKTGGDALGPAERVLEGACCLVLCRIHLDLAEEAHNAGNEAGRNSHVDSAVARSVLASDLLASYLPQVPGYAAKRQDAACSLSTAFACRGVCDVRASKFEESYEWFAKAQDPLKEFALPGSNEERMLQQVSEQLEHAQYLHKFSGSSQP